VIGRLEGSNSGGLVQALDHAMNSGYAQVILDLSEVKYINSAGLRELVLMMERARRAGTTLAIANPSERVSRVLELVGLDSVIEIIPTSEFLASRLSSANGAILSRQVCYCS
jgi:anti-anti-sigma factor